MIKKIVIKGAKEHHLKNVSVEIVFEPVWNKDMMSEEAKLELNL